MKIILAIKTDLAAKKITLAPSLETVSAIQKKCRSSEIRQTNNEIKNVKKVIRSLA